MHQSAQKIEKFAQLSAHLKATNSAVISQQNVHAVSLGSSTINAIHSVANLKFVALPATSVVGLFLKISFHLFFQMQKTTTQFWKTFLLNGL